MDKAAKKAWIWIRSLFRKLQDNLYLGMAIISLWVICGLGLLFWNDLICLMTGGISSWEDARGVGLFIGGTVAPVVTFLGLHLSSNRLIEDQKQTSELRKQNDAREAENAIVILEKALDLIAHESESKRITGLALMRQQGLTKDIALSDATLSALIAFAELHKHPKKEEFSPRDGKMITTSRYWFRQESSEALKSFLHLSNRKFEANPQSAMFTRLDNVDFAKPNIFNFEAAAFAEIRFCNFHWMQAINTRLTDINFFHCDFSSSRFDSCTLDRVVFENCDISNLAFFHNNSADVTELFKQCYWSLEHMPFVPIGTILPIPHIERENRLSPMTETEARAWSNRHLAAEFDSEDNFIGMRVMSHPGPN